MSVHLRPVLVTDLTDEQRHARDVALARLFSDVDDRPELLAASPSRDRRPA